MKLLRCYDNRLRPTERHPDLYEKIGICEEILVLKDTNRSNTPLHSFEQIIPVTEEPAIDWLFKYRGQVKIISAPFHPGVVHYATRPDHFIPIINDLESLHTNDYVHGDIRAYNMVRDYDESDSNTAVNIINFSIRDHFGNLTRRETILLYPIIYINIYIWMFKCF